MNGMISNPMGRRPFLRLATLSLLGLPGLHCARGKTQTALSLPAPPAPPKPEPKPITIIPRNMWAPAGLAHPENVDLMGGVSRITIHHDGLPRQNPQHTEEIHKRITDIRVSHCNKRWADIGYHYIVDPLGRVWEGRPLAYQGAHVLGENERNIGVLVLGNFEAEWPTPEALSGLCRFTRHLMDEHRVPVNLVHTHLELRPTGCPGQYLQPEVEKARIGGFPTLLS